MQHGTTSFRGCKSPWVQHFVILLKIFAEKRWLGRIRARPSLMDKTQVPSDTWDHNCFSSSRLCRTSSRTRFSSAMFSAE